MTLPKYILHPLVLLLVFGSLFILLRLGSVTMEDLKDMHRIVDYNQGQIWLEGSDMIFFLDDPRLAARNETSNSELKSYFTGKFVRFSKLPADGRIHLPVELYEGACTGSSAHKTDDSSCQPIIINP